jgi:hypothetical protein
MRRRHVNQKGVAMAEFVIVLPVALAMWMGIEYFRSGYARRIQALGQSQTQAWKLAYSNDMSCFKGASNWGGLAGAGVDYGAGGGDQANKAVDSYSQNAKSSSMFLYGTTRQTGSVATKKAPWDNKRVGRVSGATYVLCNEVVPPPSDDANVFTPLKSFIEQAVSK